MIYILKFLPLITIILLLAASVPVIAQPGTPNPPSAPIQGLWVLALGGIFLIWRFLNKNRS